MSVVDLDKLKAHLNIDRADDDGKLQTFLDAAEAAIAEKCGPLAPTPVTAKVYASGGAFVLDVVPVVSLTSLTPTGGTAYDASTLDVDLGAGIISQRSGSFPASGHDIVYVAGRATCPDDLVLAVLELARHMWETQRGPTRRPGGTTSDAASNTIPGAAYLFPFRVEQLIAPHVQLGFGFA